MARRSGAERAVRHAARRIGLQAAALIAIVVLALATLAMWITARQQRDTDHQLVADTAVQADDVVDPPPNCWLVIGEGAEVQTTPGLPRGVPDLAGVAARLPVGGVDERDLRLPGGHYLVLTRRRSASETVQVVLDLGPADLRRRALLTELGLAAGTGLLLAGAVGLLLARRVLAPLRRTMDLQRQFVADASHELRAPLTLLHTRAQLLERALAGVTAPVRAEAAGVVRDTGRLAELVEDLLLAADPLTTSDRTEVELVPLAEEAVAAARPHAGQRGIELELVAPGREVWAEGWAPALHRALIALIDNAIGHTPPGGRITVVVQEKGRRAELVVRDTGPGFDPALADRLTERFASGGPGHGLGLALVSDIADRHGGELHAAVVPDGGAEFTVSIPARRR